MLTPVTVTRHPHAPLLEEEVCLTICYVFIINGNVCWLIPSDVVFAQPGLCCLAGMVMIVLNVGDIGNLWTS